MAKLPNYQYIKNLVEKLMLEDLRNKVILQILETLNDDISTISFKLQKIDSPASGKVAQYQLVDEEGTPVTGSVIVDIPDVKQGSNIQVTKGSDGSFTIALSSSALSGYLTKAVADTTYAAKSLETNAQMKTDNGLNTTSKEVVGSINEINTKLGNKQDTLVSGTNIKTLNGQSLLGSGNITLDLSIYQVVSTLPSQDIDPNKIYLVLDSEGEEQNLYKEYIYVNDAWELLGTYKATVDLTDYLTKDEASELYATQASLSSHTSNTSNPHNVTKSQIGLGNVDNTSDLDKPISTAVQNKLAVYTTVPELTAAYTIPVNATTQEKIYQIAIGATVYNVTGAEGIIWQNGVAPVAEANSTLVVSVINNLAVWGTFKA